MTDLNIASITATKGHVQAVAFAQKGGTALSTLLGGIATAKETERMGPIQTMLFLETTYSDDEQSAIPVVGSKQGDTGNLPYDRYTATVQTNDGPRKVPGSWFSDVIKTTDEAVTIKARIDYCDNVTLEGCPPDILAMGTGERAVEKKRLRQRLADMRTALTKGAMLLHHAAMIAAKNPDLIKVKMPIRKRKDTGEMEVFGNTVRLQDPSGELEDRVLTVSQFTALKPDAMAGDKDKWTIAALEKTGARAPKKKGTKLTATTIPVPTTVEAFLMMCNTIATAIDNGTDEGKAMESKLYAEFAKAGEKGDDAVSTVGTVCLAFDSIWTVIQPRVDNINARKAAAINAKAKVATN